MEREILTVCVLIRVPNGILKTPLLFATMDLVSTSHLSLVFTYVSTDEKFSSWRVFVSSRRVIFGKLPERSMAGIGLKKLKRLNQEVANLLLIIDLLQLVAWL